MMDKAKPVRKPLRKREERLSLLGLVLYLFAALALNIPRCNINIVGSGREDDGLIL